MEKFNFDTGMKEFEINDAVTVSFNPTDPETIKKIFDVFDSLDAKQAAYKAEIARCGETKEIFDIARRRDAHDERLRAGRRSSGLVQSDACHH